MIAIIALLVVDPKRLPEVMRALGRGVIRFRNATAEVRAAIEEERDRLERELKEKPDSK